ncbi:MAG: hypothetical protein BGO38_07005 [Cellulomonas sp. 73-145]|uniref:hypothetical protein n=1 Tax=Cellulomonas sp. 73-145 TaxID=1895739 RepID=UPI0009267569|nr:hypothetical protein [Cellulomonas sp. 73-145]MBN9328086.1 hypothetical protein [Cellulomonas sp.]OJV57965.1 MAG: hypothetical protein BGO38_07005 [Cellulomonas sp. 73-145]
MARQPVPTVDQLRPSSSSLAFLQPTEPAEVSPSDLPDPTALGDPWSSISETSDSAGEPDPSPAPTSSPASSAEPLLSKGTIEDLAQELVIGAGEMLNQTFARDGASQQVGMWLTDDHDAENIGTPLARIVNRHETLGAVGNPDVADAIAAGVGVGVYLWRQLQRWNAARQLRRAGQLAADQAAAAAGESEHVDDTATAPPAAWPAMR